MRGWTLLLCVGMVTAVQNCRRPLSRTSTPGLRSIVIQVGVAGVVGVLALGPLTGRA